MTRSGVSVSIVIPVYNAVKYIDESLNSVLSQDHADLEIIVIDDGSTDGTAERLVAYADRVRLHRQPNAGQSAALRTGWAMSRGDVLGYLSADDRLKSGAIRRVSDVLSARPEVVLVYPDFDLIDEGALPIGHVRAPDFSRALLFGQLHCLPGPGALFRRSAYEQAGPWSSEFRQIPDLDFFLRLALRGDFARLSNTLADFRIHGQSATYRVAPFDRGEEPLKLVRSFLRRDDLPDDVRAWAPSMTSHAYFLSAAIHGRSRRTKLALRRLGAGIAMSPGQIFTRKVAAHLALIFREAMRGWRRSIQP